MHLCLDLYLLLQFRSQRLLQPQAELFVMVEDSVTLVRSIVDAIRFGSSESWCKHHLRSLNGDIPTEVMTIERPSSSTGFGGLFKKGKVVRIFIQHSRSAEKLSQKMIDPHCSKSLPKSFQRQQSFETGGVVCVRSYTTACQMHQGIS